MSISTETVTPVSIKFFCDIELFESFIVLKCIVDVTSYDALHGAKLRKYLEAQAVELKKVLSMSILDHIVKK